MNFKQLIQAKKSGPKGDSFGEKKKPELKKSDVEKFEDKNKDGVDDKKEEAEKKSAVVEQGGKFEKAEYKKEKHTVKNKNPTQERQENKTPKQTY